MAWPSNTSERCSNQLTRSALGIEHSQAPWTAARCQRLLRHLSSKIALLRKEKQRASNNTELPQPHGVNLDSAVRKGNERMHHQGGRRRGSEHTDVADEEWGPNPRPRKKIKRTYSSRNLTCQKPSESSQSSTSEQKNQFSTEITIPNGLFRSQRHLDLETEVTNAPQDTEEVSRTFPRETQNVGNDRPSSRYRVKLSFEEQLVYGIQMSLVALLRATKDAKPPLGHGTRSLFETCLRKIPDYIAEEELRGEEEDPESKIDVSSMVYNELESLGTSHSAGWEPLRHVVRAHGTNIVGGAIREGLIGVTVARDIVRSCHSLGTYEEAETMLHCLMESIEPWLKSAGRTRTIVEVLDSHVQVTGCQSYRYRELAWLLRSGRLPLDWIARQDMIETWNRAIQTITQDTEDTGTAIELLRLVTSMTYGLCDHDPGTLVHGLRLSRQSLRKEANGYIVNLGYQTQWPGATGTARTEDNRESQDEKASSTVLSLVTVLCAIGLLRSARTASEPSESQVSNLAALHDIATDSYQMLELASDGMIHLPDEGMVPALLSAGLVRATLCRNKHDFATTIPSFFDPLMSLDKNGSAVEEGGSFLCAVAECCARAASEDVFDHTRKAVAHICHIAESLRPISTSYQSCNRVGIAAALEYADRTKQPKHLHWALNLEQTVTGAHLESARRTPAKTPLRGQMQTGKGYRWEAGICEWVARTPAIISSMPPDLMVRKALPRMGSYDNRSVSIKDNDQGVAMPPGPSGRQHSSPASFQFTSGWAKRLRRTRSQGVAGSETGSECSPTTVFFSHINVQDDSDESSTPSSSQEAQKGCRLQEMMNSVARQLKQCGAAQQRRSESYTRHGKECDFAQVEILRSSQDSLDVQDVMLDSEDELSYL
ncbi:MAG: hypothetical protein Q9218_005912 [Villophora microphyllina]